MPRLRAAALAALVLLPAAAPAQHSHPPHHHAGGSPVRIGANDDVPLFPNLGNYTHRISTRDTLAQKYFDQGLRLIYGFNHQEAALAFRQAARLDSTCAICWWGVAQSNGPDINQPLNQQRWRTAAAAVDSALRKLQWASEAEQRYVAAARARFHPLPNFADTAATRRARERMDQAYADAMGEAMRRLPGDPDAATLFAEAMMDLAPWEQWSLDGRTMNPGTDTILKTLKAVNDRWPDHPGSNHFYIHAWESSAWPGTALASAEKLARLMPGASHIVHMPSHTFLRVGRYNDAADANLGAVKADTAYLKTRRALGRYPRYFAHNLEFLWAAAGMAGRRADALRAAADLSREWPADSVRGYPETQHFLTTKYVVMVRFGMWDDIRRDSANPIPEGLFFARGGWHYAQGFALVRKGRPRDAEAHLDALRRLAVNPYTPDQSINSGQALLRVAARTLAGEIAAARGDSATALRELRAAVALQSDTLRYDEPPPFYFPVRHSLGAVLLQFGRAKDAERVYCTDLGESRPAECTVWDQTARPFPENGWALKGLENALRAQVGRTADADRVRRRFEQTWWPRADTPIDRSRL